VGWVQEILRAPTTEHAITFLAQDFAVITQATAAEVVAVLNAGLVGAIATVGAAGGVELATASAGRASQLQVLGGTAVPGLAFASDIATGTGSVDRLSAATPADIDALLVTIAAPMRAEAGAQGELVLRSVSTGPQARLQVQPGTAPALGLDLLEHAGGTAGGPVVLRVRGRDPGSYANRLTVTVRAGAGAAFDLLVTEGTRTRE
jgi:hypothetical protein